VIGTGVSLMLVNAAMNLCATAAEHIPWEGLNAIAYATIKGTAVSVAKWADQTLLGDGFQDTSQDSGLKGTSRCMSLRCFL
jgi:hypothetical protein